MAKRVLVGMSGGVDSSTSAALLADAGYEVTGAFMDTGIGSQGEADDAPGWADAEKVAGARGIPFQVLDLREDFEGLMRYFCSEYDRGRTPNPCVRCNPTVKFRRLIGLADELGCEYVATGHYARIGDCGGRLAIRRGRDESKEQSYMLHRLGQEQLARVIFPLGEMTKQEVRRKAIELSLPVAARPESQEICFIPDNDYRAFVRSRSAPKPGLIKDRTGRTLGEHPGIQFFTIGQRRGLGVAVGKPMYVVSIDPVTNVVTIGPVEALRKRSLIASEVNWMAIDQLRDPIEVKAQIRYNHEAASATLAPEGKDQVRADFAEPQPAVTPGQAAVFYDGDVVVGGGWIEEAF